MKAGDRVYFLEPHRFARRAGDVRSRTGVVTAGPVFVPDLGETFYKAYSDADPSDVEYLMEGEAEVLPKKSSFPSRFRADDHGRLR